jgi:hypothetical protein
VQKQAAIATILIKKPLHFMQSYVVKKREKINSPSGYLPAVQKSFTGISRPVKHQGERFSLRM